jgi:predicted O-methyltransferase YrrM
MSTLLERLVKGSWRHDASQGEAHTRQAPDFAQVAVPGIVAAVCHQPGPGQSAWYPAPLIGARTAARHVLATETIRGALELTQQLTQDPYLEYLRDFYRHGLEQFGDRWHYADLTTTVLGLAELLRPRSYLEIGVRRGRSACAVAAKVPECALALFDKWVANYAGIDNPGPEFVAAELRRIGHRGPLEFISGDSHETLPAYWAKHPGTTFDLITVDGDHSDRGAAQDLRDVLPHLSVGGAVVFDDLCHPKHLSLRSVWTEVVASRPNMSSWIDTDVGYGVAFAIRKW